MTASEISKAAWAGEWWPGGTSCPAASGAVNVPVSVLTTGPVSQ
ncbi:hypothetical protein ACWKT3_16355 [Streptomyces violaceus]